MKEPLTAWACMDECGRKVLYFGKARPSMQSGEWAVTSNQFGLSMEQPCTAHRLTRKLFDAVFPNRLKRGECYQVRIEAKVLEDVE